MTRQQQRIAEAFNVRGYYHGGMGDVTSQQITSAVGGSLMASAALATAIGGPLAGGIVAAVGALTQLVGGFFKPDLTKIQASNIVNQIEAQVLIPMRASWQSLQASQKTVSVQAHYLNVFDQAWAAVVQGCGNAALGDAGVNCVADRQQGACHYTLNGQTPGNPPNDCGNWFVWYRDVVANDPNVIPDPVAGGSPYQIGSSSFVGSVDSAAAGVSSALGISPVVIGLGLIAGALLLVGD